MHGALEGPKAGLAARPGPPATARLDFDSPLAEQYDVHATPSFRIHDPSGAFLAAGDAAKDLVREWYGQAQLFEHADQRPDISDRYRAPSD